MPTPLEESLRRAQASGGRRDVQVPEQITTSPNLTEGGMRNAARASREGGDLEGSRLYNELGDMAYEDRRMDAIRRALKVHSPEQTNATRILETEDGQRP